MGALLLLSLFINFILLDIVDHFLTYEGVVRRGQPELMCGTKELIEKYGDKEKALKVRFQIFALAGTILFIFFLITGNLIPEMQLIGNITFWILVFSLSIFVIINAVHLRKKK